MDGENIISSQNSQQKALAFLDGMGIAYALQEHPAVYTCEEAALYDNGDGAADCKNLFLTNAGKSGYFLAIIEASKKLRAKELSRSLGEKGLTFASEDDLLRLLGLTTGAVSPFGLVNDGSRVVTVIIDNSILSYNKLKFHPNVNTASVTLKTEDFMAVLQHLGNKLICMDMNS